VVHPEPRHPERDLLSPAWTRPAAAGWQIRHDLATHDTGLGVHLADLPTARLAATTKLILTLHWSQDGRWEGTGFVIEVRASDIG
jgi:glucoamylase